MSLSHLNGPTRWEHLNLRYRTPHKYQGRAYHLAPISKQLLGQWNMLQLLDHDCFMKCVDANMTNFVMIKAYNDYATKDSTVADQLGDQQGKKAKVSRAQLFDKVSEQKNTNKGTSVNTQFSKQSILGKPPSSSKPKLYYVTPFPKSMVIPKVGKSNALSKPVTLNSVPSSRESTVMNNERVIA
ncbi:hypothetical protein Tco_0403266 [Tanacetum coccineum]